MTGARTARSAARIVRALAANPGSLDLYTIKTAGGD